MPLRIEHMTPGVGLLGESDGSPAGRYGSVIEGIPGVNTDLLTVLQTNRLYTRPSRSPDYRLEGQALASIVRELAMSPIAVLDRTAVLALALCNAQSAGLALLGCGSQKDVFTRPAIAGAWSRYVNSTAPRSFSPYGVVVEQDTPQLFRQPQRYYTYVADVRPTIEEVLLAPFQIDGVTVGALWVVLHDRDRAFDSEDERRLSSLAKCASAVHQVALSVERLAGGAPEAEHLVCDLMRLDQILAATPQPISAPRPAMPFQRALSKREFDVVRMVAEGYTNRAIAASLGLSAKTVETYRARACDKLGFRDRADFVRYAVVNGLLQPPAHH